MNETNTPVLRLDSIRKSFNGNEVLKGISFDVQQHEVVALLGPCGSGKSTLMKCVNLLEQVDDGQIWLADTRALELLDRIGMRAKASAYPDQLSGGQQQRVAIARALMTNPELLLLDEITSALDPMLVGEVLDMVAELKEQGTTILMATHEMSFAHDAADRIVLLRHGVIAENGSPQEVMDESQDPETREFFSHFRN